MVLTATAHSDESRGRLLPASRSRAERHSAASLHNLSLASLSTSLVAMLRPGQVAFARECICSPEEAPRCGAALHGR